MPLKRSLGLPALTFYALGMILGAGVYSVIGAAAGEAGEGLWVSFAMGAVVALLTGLSYAELATMFPKAGAEYAYLREAVPSWRWLPVMVGVLLVLSGVATAATVSVAFDGYLREWVDVPRPIVAAVLLVAFTGLNIVGIKESAWVNIVFTIVEIAGLALVIAVAVVRGDVIAAAAPALTAGVLPGAALVFFAYLGFENVAALAEETKEPSRAMPRALLISVAVSAALYVAVAIAVLALVPPEQLADSESPLTSAVGAEAPTVARVLAGIALFATANTGLIALVTASRLVYGMAEEGDVPKVLGKLLPERETPWIAALGMLGLALALLPLGELGAIASLSSFGALVAFIVVNAAVVVLRVRKPDAKRPFRVPGAIGRVPVAPVLGALASATLVTQLDAGTFAIGGIALAVGGGLYALRRLWPQAMR